MQTLPKMKVTLHERMDQIERQNLRLKSYLLFLLFTLLALLLMGAKAGMNDGSFNQITARGITIVDEAGKELVLIGSDEKGSGIRILNSTGTRVLGIGTTGDDKGAGLLIADKQGRPRFGLGMDMGFPSFAMVDENGKKLTEGV